MRRAYAVAPIPRASEEAQRRRSTRSASPHDSSPELRDRSQSVSQSVSQSKHRSATASPGLISNRDRESNQETKSRISETCAETEGPCGRPLEMIMAVASPFDDGPRGDRVSACLPRRTSQADLTKFSLKFKPAKLRQSRRTLSSRACVHQERRRRRSWTMPLPRASLRRAVPAEERVLQELVHGHKLTQGQEPEGVAKLARISRTC